MQTPADSMHRPAIDDLPNISPKSLTGRVLPPLAALCVFGCLAAPRGASLALAVFALAALGLFAREKQLRSFKLPPLLTAVLACCGYFLLSIWWSPSPRALEMGRDALIVMTSCTILFMSLGAWTPALARRVLQAATLGFSLGLAYFVMQALADFPVNRWIGQLGPEHVMALSNVPKRTAAVLLLLAWPAGLYLAEAGPRTQRRLALLLAAAVLGLLPLLYSRTAMIGGIAGLLTLWLAVRQPRFAAVAMGLLLPLAVPVTLALVLLLPGVDQWLLPYLPFSGQERLSIWKYTLEQGVAFWPLGTGLDGSRIFTPQIQTHPHNVYLQVFLEGGAPGLALTLAVGAFAWRWIRAVRPGLRPYLWGFVASQIVLLSIAYGLWQGWWLAAHGFAVFLLALAVHGNSSRGVA